MTEKNPYPSDQADKVLVRMPDGMRDRLKEAAKANNRTMNAEIVARLESTFAAPTTSSAVDLSQTVQELQSLQELGALNYELQRATHNLDAAQQQFSTAWHTLQQALANGDEAAQKTAKAQCTHWQSVTNDLKNATVEIEAQISRVHFERKANGLKELRHVKPVSVSVTSHFSDKSVSALKGAAAKRTSGF